MPGALAGIRVVEFANYVSGPYAGMLLADLGASVIKIENPDGGDPFRYSLPGLKIKIDPIEEMLDQDRRNLERFLRDTGS